MHYFWLLLFLPVAATYGWFSGKKSAHNSTRKQSDQFTRDYFVGLNFLLNEQPDKAVDVFTRLVEVDSETIETHLALGNLFRRRGEVGRAIRIHQNLIARPQLMKQERLQALLALGQDYLRAGVLDRAERLFYEVAAADEYVNQALQFLLDIYQQQKNWEKAIETAHQLTTLNHTPMHPLIAHYHCEMAVKMIRESRFNEARTELKLALKEDSKCVRSNFLLGDIERTAGQYKAALHHYQQIRSQDPDYFSEVLNSIVYCYEQLNDDKGLLAYLLETLTLYPRISVVLALADRLVKTQGEDAATAFITAQLRQRPSLSGLRYLIDLQLRHAEANAKDNLLILQDLAADLLRNKPIYRCSNCGFKGKTLVWLCPSCKNWSSMKPILATAGD